LPLNIVNLLLNDKGNVNIKNNQGITPYDLADRELKSKINMYLNVEN
jgi:ankyrin repeat protein